MERMKIDLWTYDVGADFASPMDCAAQMTDRVLQSWDDGADIAVFPEFAWMALERFIAGPDKLRGVAHLFWNDLWPGIQSALDRFDKAAVLGSVPFVDESGAIFNRAPLLCGGRVFHQDKIHLTPWENAFTGGGPLCIWTFRDVRIATIICLDIEVPELSSAMRGRHVDLVLVPSATETTLGVERVHRCANARSVELGCHVAVSQLVGRMESELIDENVGALAAYAPSQSVFVETPRQDLGTILHDGFHRKSVSIDIAALREMRSLTGETNPSLLSTPHIQIIESP
jgi:predicted amidohydrolase